MYRDFYCIFNGNKDKDIGIETINRPKIPSTTPIYNTSTIEGREGTLNEIIGFEDIKINVDYNFYTLDDVNNLWRRVKAWFLNIKDNTLQFSDDIEVFFKVKRVVLPEDAERGKRIGRFTVTFVCEPFSYFLDGLEEIDLKIGENYIFNPGDYFSKPIFKIYGEGIVDIKVNDKDSVSVNIGQSIIIDTFKKLSYKEEIKEKRNNKLTGKYENLYLDIGANKINISIKGRLDKFILISNWRSY